jgi:hypothetical protein
MKVLREVPSASAAGDDEEKLIERVRGRRLD